MNIIIVGRGSLATAISSRCLKEGVSHNYWEDKKVNKQSVVLYCGSERLFKDVFNFCRSDKVPLVLLSTSITYPKKTDFPFFAIPNSSTEVRNFITSVVEFARQTPYSKVTMIESHQKAKKDISGTALMIVKSLGENAEIITSIRDPKKQIKMGIPKEYLEGHAYHKISFAHDGVQTDFSVLVLGRETYAKGAIDLARKVLKGKAI